MTDNDISQVDIAPPAAAAADAAAPGADVHRPDALLECLLVLARAHGCTLTRDAATAGLPLVNHRLTPSLFDRAARRAGLTSNLARRPLERLNAALFPVVLILADEQACVLLGWSEDGSSARVIFPDLGDAEAELRSEERRVGKECRSRW